MWASAGHPPALIVRAGGAVEFAPLGGLVLGLPDLILEDTALTLAPGDGIVLYTDGATDAHAPERMLTQEDLAAALAQRPLASAEALAGALYAAALPRRRRPAARRHRDPRGAHAQRAALAAPRL